MEHYRPITAVPFQIDDTYCELIPCDVLKPYIRCFWGTKRPVANGLSTVQGGLVIPDTCMDLIFDINYTQNSCNGFFCALDERSYRTESECSEQLTATFAIRFYAWTAILFAERDFRDSRNRSFSADEFYHGLRTELEPLLFDVLCLQEKAELAEKFLLKRLRTNRIHPDLMNAVNYMLRTSGRARISELCGYTAVSEKQLERIFNCNLGISPKQFSSLIRYQLLWQEMLYRPDFNILDAVERYGYTDQSHLLRDFKRRHLMTPKQAIEFALQRR